MNLNFVKNNFVLEEWNSIFFLIAAQCYKILKSGPFLKIGPYYD